MTVPVRFKKTAIVGIFVLSAAGLSACGGDKRDCVPNASGPTSIERVASVDTTAAFVPLRGGGSGGSGGGGGGSRGGGSSSSSSTKGGSAPKSGSTSGSSTTKKHTSNSGSTGFWFFGGGGSKSCPAGQHLR